MASAYALVPKLPRGILLGVGQIVGVVGFYVHGEGRRTAFENLRAAFPGRYSEDEIEKIVRKCYRSWAQSYLDQLWTSQLTKENYRDFVTYEFEDEEAFLDRADKGSIMMMPHYGNFEWAAACLAFSGFKYTAIAQDFKNPRLTAIFRENRENLGHQLISQDKAMLKLLRVLKRGGHAAFLPDLTVKPGKAATVIRVFGLKVSVTVLGAFLVKRQNLPVLTGVPLIGPDGTYTGKGLAPETFPPEATEQEIAQRCWDLVEPFITRRPENWLWMYKHFRFRPAEDGARYPAYANRSKPFDKLEKQLEEVYGSGQKSSEGSN